MNSITLCKGAAHRGPFQFAKVADWMTCACGTDIMTDNLENNRAALVPTPKEEFEGVTQADLRGEA